MLRESLMPPPASARAESALALVRSAAMPTIALLLLVQYRAAAVPWGLSRLVFGERALGAVPGLRFARVLGSGRHGGFGLAPSLERQGLIGFFDDEASARAFAEHSQVMRAYREHASEMLLALLRPTSCRGSWGGVSLSVRPESTPVRPEPERNSDHPELVEGQAQPERNLGVAALTRAAIRWRHARRFWQHSPPAEHGVARAEGCRLAVGLGEAPLVRQATFSLWDSSEAMDAYARRGAHAAAIHGALREGWFSESMFVRFAPIAIQGTWHGKTFN